MMSPSYRLPPVLRRLVRQQRGSMGAAALIVLTLSLALGAATAVIGIADRLLLRAVPFRDAGQLVYVTTGFPGMKLTGMNLSGPEALEFQELTRAFSSSGPFLFTGLVVQGAAQAELASGVEISKGALDALDLHPIAGRGFTDEEYLKGGPAVAILGYGLWTRAFGADRTVVGRVVQLGGVSREIVGILPGGISLLNRQIDVLLPLGLSRGDAGSRANHPYHLVARINERRTFEDAAADVHRATEIWREETGEMHVPTPAMHPLEMQPLVLATTGMSREPIAALAGAVAFVLLIACANISNLLVARVERRRTDLAVQLALGATKARLLWDSLLEGLLLAVSGGLGGLVVASFLIDLLRATWPVAAEANLSLDPRVLGVTSGMALLTGAVIGVLPVLRLDVRRTGASLTSAGRGTRGPGRMRLQRTLIAVQVALAVLLSASAGLMVRSLLAVTAVATGFEPRGVLRAQISLPPGSYREDARVWSFYERTLDRLRGVPGVTSVAVMSGLPPLRRANNTSFLLDGNEVMDHTSIHQVDFVQHISPDYLRTLGIAITEGRPLADTDDERAAPSALVNETLARRFWPNESAVGRRLKPAGNIGTWFTIVGVVSDVRQNGIQFPVGSELYVTHRQARRLMSGFMPRTMNILVRGEESPRALAESVQMAVREIDRSAAVSGIASMETIVNRTIAQPRLLAWTFSGFALLALVVACVGVYAVTTYAVGARTAELGVRAALGARPWDLLHLVVRGAVPTIGFGMFLGIAGAFAAARLVRNLLFGIEPVDPISILAGGGVIGLSALLATVLPARRAARVDPLTALRD